MIGGMRPSSGQALVVLLLLAAPALASCGDSDNTTDDAAPPPSSSPSDPESGGSPSAPETSGTSESSGTTGATSGGTALPAACEVITAEEVGAAFAVSFGPGSPGGGGTSEGDLEWQSEDCSFEAEDLLEVELALTAPEDFTAGEFQCPEPTAIASTVTPVEGLPAPATQAWWDRDDAPPLEATLRVCTDAYNFEVQLEYEDGVDFQGDPQQQATALAGVVLANLG